MLVPRSEGPPLRSGYFIPVSHALLLAHAFGPRLQYYTQWIKKKNAGQTLSLVKMSSIMFNPIPDDKILDWSKLKQIADDIFKCT